MYKVYTHQQNTAKSPKFYTATGMIVTHSSAQISHWMSTSDNLLLTEVNGGKLYITLTASMQGFSLFHFVSQVNWYVGND